MAIMEKVLDLPRRFSGPRPSATDIDLAWGRVQTALDMLTTAMILQSSRLVPTSVYREVRQECLAREKEAMDLTKQWWRGVPGRYRRHLPVGLREDSS